MLKENEGALVRSSYINECEDIKVTLKQVASQYKIDMDLLDFDLQSVITYTKKVYDYEFSSLNLAQAEVFLSKRDNLVEPNLVIKQCYGIVIRKRERREHRFFLKTDKDYSYSTLYFQIGFVYNEESFDELYMQIKKQKAWNKILIYNETEEKKALKSFLKELSYPLKQEVEYRLNVAINFIPTKEAKLEFKKQILMHHFQTILPNEVVCVFYKPIIGKPGRNIKGEYIIPKEPKSIHEVSPLQYDKHSILVKESELVIEYIAKNGGILHYEDEFLLIQDTLEAKEISAKTTGSLIGQLNSGTTINVTESDSLKEAIGRGMKIQASCVNIEGNVGADAIIHAKEVNVGGQTHQDSKIYADTISIHNHKGYVKGKNIKIDTLETGIIEGDRVEVNKMYGGKIYADEIIVHYLHSHALFCATHKIRVHSMDKGENRFFISANYSPSARENYNALLETKNKSIKEAIQLTKELKVQSLEARKQKSIADENRKILIHYKNTKTIPPKYLLDNFETYHKLITSLKEKRQKINELSVAFKDAKDKLAKLDLQTKTATIEVQSGWVGYNEVRYTLHSPKLELSLTPKFGDGTKVIFNKNDEKLELIEE
ncbi:FapA family protein [Helicobacter burdigaliensis]|uniref:FapA family protein n=1 Tax=Helicobacter burdigaliensis TaxID=2315334 RepID=UPI000EF733A9|nr:FapA family protein [Helicobacter burdigaliensis]